jgi:signal transduction histidine kinase
MAARLREWLIAPIWAIFAVMAVVLVAAVLLCLRFSASLDALRASALATSEQVGAANAVMSALEEVEIAQHDSGRGKSRGLAAAQGRLRQSLADLDRLSMGGDLAELTRGLEGIAEAILAHASLSATRAESHQTVLDSAPTDATRRRMDDARGIVAALTVDANVERERRTRILVSHEAQAIYGLAGTATLGALLLGIAALGLYASRARLSGAQAALRTESSRLQDTVDHIRDGVAVFDGANRLLLWNATFFPRSGLPLWLAQPGTGFGRFAAAAAHWDPPVLEGPPPADSPRTAQFEHGTTVLEVWRSAMPGGGQMIAVADITRRAEAEKRARQAQKLQELGQLTGGVAHDFNNLLQVISVNLQLLDARLPSDWPLRSRLGAAMAGVERGARLVRHLLAFARRQPLAPKIIDAGALLYGMDDMLVRAAGPHVEVRFAIDPELGAVRVDPEQLENAVLNLVVNARDAMPTGGRVTVAGSNVAIGADPAGGGSTDLSAGNYVVIAVTDTGVGMSAEQIARAVEPFYTTKPEGKGTGLGLSMVYGFAKQSGGHFRLTSAAGEGTTACLFIPRRDQPAAAVAGSSDVAGPQRTEFANAVIVP